MYSKGTIGEDSVAWRGIIKIKFMNVEDYTLTLYVFSNIIVITKITLTLLGVMGLTHVMTFLMQGIFIFYQLVSTNRKDIYNCKEGN